MNNKMSKFILAALAVGMISLGSVGIVNANNHTDTSWDIILPRYRGNAYTNPRLKTDKSRTYVKCSQVGKGHINVWAQKSDGVEISNPKYQLGPNQSVRMYNRAYEIYGRVKIRLAIESQEGYFVHVHANGKWSPDSVK